MTKKKLWAPWRKKFLTCPKERGCIFCEKPRFKKDRRDLILERGKTMFTILNLYPYNNGHVMIAPYRHLKSPTLMTPEEWGELFYYMKRTVAVIDAVLKPHGYNMGMNVGRVAGAGFDKHVHWHIVPRWNGDTNFMPVVAGEKVISESLDALWGKFSEALYG